MLLRFLPLNFHPCLNNLTDEAFYVLNLMKTLPQCQLDDRLELKGREKDRSGGGGGGGGGPVGAEVYLGFSCSQI
ncbi:pentatricopeptide repeat-containing protein [Pyrus ussuriensis x Pyrus communis]|uniref:Pentatricopeptide repeat-containing protein n=1 Tax=Pyrus ussuriensis x Pyrus communis TaxID=2448454 RepID=A0A5N5HQD6_9ROSA|nr:pentatricopeptide repeat-containing protein [Pyrus ussuriensis x Pyrus communis]